MAIIHLHLLIGKLKTEQEESLLRVLSFIASGPSGRLNLQRSKKTKRKKLLKENHHQLINIIIRE